MGLHTNQILQIYNYNRSYLQLFKDCCDYMFELKEHKNPVELKQEGIWHQENLISWDKVENRNGF